MNAIILFNILFNYKTNDANMPDRRPRWGQIKRYSDAMAAPSFYLATSSPNPLLSTPNPPKHPNIKTSCLPLSAKSRLSHLITSTNDYLPWVVYSTHSIKKGAKMPHFE